MMRNLVILGAALVLTPGLVYAQVAAGASPDAPQAPNPVVRDGFYLIQTGDLLDVRVFQYPELNQEVRVRPDGRISVVLFDDVAVAGMSTREVDDLLTARYAQLYQKPEVTVIVREFANMKVFVGGEVGQPGMIPLMGEMTITGAVFQAGGFKPTARTDSVVLLRNEGGKAVARRMNVKDILAKGGDLPLQPFDVIYVPLSRIGAVDRFVDQYVRQLIPFSLNAGFSYLFGDRVVIR